MAKEPFSRAQVEWALWRTFAPRGPRPAPTVFATRIKKLLDLDRGSEFPSEDPNAAPFAFSEEATSGSGKAVGFEAFDAFCLALALDLLDFGLKQSEIVFMLRHIRHKLRDAFEEIAQDYPTVGGKTRAEDFPHLPIREGFGGVEYADIGFYMIFRKIELREVFGGHRRGASMPLIIEPRFCAGLAEVSEALQQLDATRKAMVIDLAGLVIPLRNQLERVPKLGRVVEA